MTTFTNEVEWRASKQAMRRQRHRSRIQEHHEPEPTAWLAAVRRDDATDPVMAVGDREYEVQPL